MSSTAFGRVFAKSIKAGGADSEVQCAGGRKAKTVSGAVTINAGPIASLPSRGSLETDHRLACRSLPGKTGNSPIFHSPSTIMAIGWCRPRKWVDHEFAPAPVFHLPCQAAAIQRAHKASGSLFQPNRVSIPAPWGLADCEVVPSRFKAAGICSNRENRDAILDRGAAFRIQ
jgi:hypothetical protein